MTEGAVPRLSVVMPVHNAIPYLGAAIEAILRQSFGDFEFVIGDDCSTDGSAECAEAFARLDPRIRVLRSAVRLGPARSSNWVANEARAPLVARMDADDLCHPRRLELQLRALAENPSAVLVGALFSLIDGADRPVRGVDRSTLLGRPTPPIAHSSVLYRKWAFDHIGGYCQRANYFEDAELYLRLVEVGDILVIADDLLLYRVTGMNARLTDDQAVVEQALNAMPATLKQREFRHDGSARLEPEVFRALGSLRLWAHRSPGILADMAARMRLWPLSASARVMAWALVCSLSPSMARQATRMRLAWRNWRTRRRFPPGHLFRWVPGKPSINLGRIDGSVTE
ncbi:glycosyltransferase family A protein [Rhizobacter sp. OV335]|uniref:glycosyltransferase family 2 protein n=1 Tax=Rhizobacter sp. OV335 TaxID=1500264 RepID=UPI000937A8D8|nr:glycosyltransferase family A protein [Rhizobacter sp. OV335]